MHKRIHAHGGGHVGTQGIGIGSVQGECDIAVGKSLHRDGMPIRVNIQAARLNRGSAAGARFIGKLGVAGYGVVSQPCSVGGRIAHGIIRKANPHGDDGSPPDEEMASQLPRGNIEMKI